MSGLKSGSLLCGSNFCQLGRAPQWKATLRAATRAALFAIFSVGCSGQDKAPPGWSGSLGGAGPILNVSGPCQEGESRSCSITYEQASGIVSCFRGSQNCTAGKWSACSEGVITKEADPTWAGYNDLRERMGLSLSMPVACVGNPCDPSCQWFDEDPDDIGLGGGAPTGTIPDLGGCDHGLCENGVGLDSACDPCAATVCAAEPSCCDGSNPNGWDTSCADLVTPLCTGTAPALELCDYALFAGTSLTLSTGSDIHGGALGATTSATLQGLTLDADVISGGNVTLDTGSTSASVYAGGTVSTINGATATANKLHSSLSTSLPSVPSRTVTCAAASGTTLSVGTATVTITPGNANTYNLDNAAGTLVLNGAGNYGSITANAGGTVVFGAAGTYTFGNLNLATSGVKLLFPASGVVNIDTCSTLNLSGGATVNTFVQTTNACSSYPTWDGNLWWYSSGTKVNLSGVSYQATGGHDPHAASSKPGVGASWTTFWTSLGTCSPYSYAASGAAPDALEVRYYTNATTDVFLGPGALGGGVLIAPSATVRPSAGSYTGLIYASSISGAGNFDLDASAAVGSPCALAGIGSVMDAGSCPVDVLPPLLNEPCVTGRNCQVNYRCEAPTTGSSCAHSKCEPGNALDAECDECVDRICAVSPECCSDEWDNACVSQVASVCDAVCDGYACLHQACDTGVPLEKSCDSCIDTVCNTPGFEDCCTDNWAFKCVVEFRDACGAPPVVTPPTTGGSICDYSAYGRFELNAFSSTFIGGWVGSPSSASQNIQYSDVYGSVTSSGSLNAYASDIWEDFVSGSGSVVSGTVHGSIITTLPPSPALPSKSLSCTSGAETRSGTLAPGSYGDVTVVDGQTLTLKGGTYTFNSLTLGSGGAGATLALPSDGSIVEINVCGDVRFDLNSSMSGLTPATSMYLSVYANGYFAAVGDNTLYGFIIAPNNPGGSPTGPCSSGTCDLSLLQDGFVFLGQNTELYGLVGAGRRLDTRSGALIDSTGVKDNCQLLWDPGTTVTWPACPVTLTPDNANETGTCTPNNAGYQDATCGGYDLALGIPCDDQLSVCNHGSTTFSGALEVGYWDASQKQLSTPSPISPDGICAATVTVAPGTCEPMTCSTLPSSDVTLMVDPEAKLSECDDRRLDNWSAHDQRACIGTTRTEVLRYEATCPDDTAPSWGYLAYNTTAPGASTVEFAAFAAETEGDIPASPSYTPLATAQSGSPDTQNCGTASLCKVDLTAALGLGTNQPSWIELAVTLTADGGDQPTLHDWKLTYSCIFDQ